MKQRKWYRKGRLRFYFGTHGSYHYGFGVKQGKRNTEIRFWKLYLLIGR